MEEEEEEESGLTVYELQCFSLVSLPQHKVTYVIPGMRTAQCDNIGENLEGKSGKYRKHRRVLALRIGYIR